MTATAIYVALSVAVMATWLAGIAWVARDASLRGDSAFAWGLVVYALGPIGFLIYLAKRRSYGMQPLPRARHTRRLRGRLYRSAHPR